MYSKHYDSLLKEICHYKNYPSLMPFVGQNYDMPNSPRILLIAESHYLPEESIVSKDADSWYNSDYNILSVEETSWMHTREIASCEWKSDGHMIFRELERHLAEVLDTFNGRAMNSCAYMNGFQRPSPQTGDSIKKFAKEIDFVKSAETINDVIEIIKPNLVIFVSKFAWDSLSWRIRGKHVDVELEFVCHPASGGRHWHREGYAHGVGKFKTLISKCQPR